MHNIIEKLASELIAAASCRREFNVSIGNPRMLLIASMFFHKSLQIYHLIFIHE